MTINTSMTDGNLLVKLDGRLDSSTAGELEETFAKVISSEIKSLTIDLSNVDFISSKGLRVLVSAYRNMDGRDMVLEGVNTSIMEVLKLSGLLKIFTVKEA